jgi:hypothetical protein
VSVDPSSLIFVVIIGIWAVYLLQHWVRRREQLATSRSVDRFSEAMRVLERRVPVPVTLPAQQNRPYVVAPARPAAQQAVASRPEVAMKQAPINRPAPRRTHKVRALTLLTLLVATPAVWAAHVFGTLLLWPTVTVTALFVLDLLFVRSVARRAAARRRTAMRRAKVGAVGTPVRASTPRQRPGAGAKPFPVARRVASPARAASMPAAAPSVATSALPVETVTPVHSQDAVTEVIVLEGSWEPVEVPRPTYTMKAKAERPVSSGAAPLPPESDSAPSREPLQPAIAIDELDLDSVLDRRRAAGE